MAVGSDQVDSDETAVVFLSHRTDEPVLRRYEKLSNEVTHADDVYFLFDTTNAAAADRQSVREVAGDGLRIFDHSTVTAVDYPNPWADPEQQAIVPGNIDLLILHFSLIELGYFWYWFIEYDVAFTGGWSEFFQRFRHSPAELIGTTLHPYDRHPDWYWWRSFEPAPDLERSSWVRGFFPIVCLSKEFLDVLHEAYLDGWSGHTEAVLPTLARHQGFEMEDIGGDGPYVRSENTNRFYTNTPAAENLSPGTFVYRPARPRPGRRSEMLWHPIKPNQNYLESYLRLGKNWITARLLQQ